VGKRTDTNGTFLAHNDHLYTTDVLSKSSDGAVAWSAKREAFGKTTVSNGSVTDYLLRFPGQWEDRVAGFFDNFIRSYDFYRAAYMQKDPIIPSVPYSYAANQPTIALDPFGLFSSKLGYRIHEDMSRLAFSLVRWDEDCGSESTKRLAITFSNDWDMMPTSQEIEMSHTHAMTQARTHIAGYRHDRDFVTPIRITVPLETAEQARAKWAAWIEDNLSKCNGQFLGYALHAMQDSFAKGHEAFAPWDGGFGPLQLPPAGHIYHDTWPDQTAYGNSVLASMELIEAFIQRCPFMCCE
jgi:RHS repeat-associated protein